MSARTSQGPISAADAPLRKGSKPLHFDENAACGSADEPESLRCVRTTLNGTVYVFARNPADNQVIERHRAGDTWTAWAPVPGLVAGSGPAAMAYGSELWLFARGQDGAAWWNRLVNGGWSGWEWLDGQLTSAPAAGLRLGTTKAELVVRGTNNELWLRTFPPEEGWTYWASLPGSSVGSAPTVTGYHHSGTIDVFVRDAAVGNIIQRYGLPDGSWSEWFNYDGVAVGAPTSTFARFNRLDLYYRGTTGWLYYREHPAGTGSWTLVDSTKLDSSPAATSDHYGHELIFARIGNDLHVKEASVPDTDAGLPTFGPWVSLGPIGLPQQQQQPSTGPATVIVQPPRPERLTPTISYKYRATARQTRFSKLVIRDVPAGATVRVTCARGCSAKRLSVTLRTARVVSLRKFIRRPIPVGRKVVVTVTKAEMIGSHKVLTMRRKDEPRITTRCLPPGATRPQAC